jgi:hypothetical protein
MSFIGRLTVMKIQTQIKVSKVANGYLVQDITLEGYERNNEFFVCPSLKELNDIIYGILHVRVTDDSPLIEDLPQAEPGDEW